MMRDAGEKQKASLIACHVVSRNAVLLYWDSTVHAAAYSLHVSARRRR